MEQRNKTKKRLQVKIGTNSMSILVLWDDKPIKIGDIIIGMPYKIYDNLHPSMRRLKECRYWERLKVTRLEPILFVSKV